MGYNKGVKRELVQLFSRLLEETGIVCRPTDEEGADFRLTLGGEELFCALDCASGEREAYRKLVPLFLEREWALLSAKEPLKALFYSGGTPYAGRTYAAFFLPRTAEGAPCEGVLLACLAEEERALQLDDGLLLVTPCSDAAQAEEEGDFWAQTVYTELGARIKLGMSEVSSGSLAEAYAQAKAAFSLGNLFCSQRRVLSYRHYWVAELVSDMPRHRVFALLEKYLKPGAEAVFSEKELLETADAFFYNSLNAAETARMLYLHRNTLFYRLDKIERLTGLDVRRFSDALLFRVVTILYQYLKRGDL